MILPWYYISCNIGGPQRLQFVEEKCTGSLPRKPCSLHLVINGHTSGIQLCAHLALTA